ncbi:MAG: tagaturonate epimerase family protein [Candidatus Solibacter sp.]
MLTLDKYSIGVGDRFAHQALAQLQACMMAAARGVNVIPVWNKSNREHGIVGSEPSSVRAAADAAVTQSGWKLPYHVDADHINLTTVDRFIDASDFYTLDVAASIGEAPEAERVDLFVARHPELQGTLAIPGIETPFQIDEAEVRRIVHKYLAAVMQAGAIYRHVHQYRAGRPFITEVSMDETDAPQTPPELLVILAAIADERIPVQTIAPKFTGRFNKGVDYVGDVAQFEKEFGDDLAVIAFAIAQYGLPGNLKLSVHSGSDKFSIYAPMRRALRRTGAGVHLKTAGTTWLEELIGLAEAGGDGLELAKKVYAKAFENREALCEPYAAVIDIDPAKLPGPAAVNHWTSQQYTSALRHDQTNRGFNADFRQLLHVGFKVAAKMGDQYLHMLDVCEASISRNVTTNLFDRHIVPLFLAE